MTVPAGFDICRYLLGEARAGGNREGQSMFKGMVAGVFAAGLALSAGLAVAAEMPAAEKAKPAAAAPAAAAPAMAMPAMSKFMVVTTHTGPECLKAMDEIQAQSPKLLKQCQLGCMSGNHTGWATLEGANEADVRAQLPASMREKAQITKVTMITPEEIKKAHEGMMKK